MAAGRTTYWRMGLPGLGRWDVAVAVGLVAAALLGGWSAAPAQAGDAATGKPHAGLKPSDVAGSASLRIRRSFTRNHCDKLRGSRARRCKAVEVILVTYRFRAFIPVSVGFELLLVPGTPKNSGFPPLFVRRLERTTPPGDQMLRFMFSARDLERRCRKAQEKCFFSVGAILDAADPAQHAGGRDAERATFQIVPSPVAKKRALAHCRKLSGAAKRRCVRRAQQL